MSRRYVVEQTETVHRHDITLSKTKKNKGWIPKIKEAFRESIGLHVRHCSSLRVLCNDERSNRLVINEATRLSLKPITVCYISFSRSLSIIFSCLSAGWHLDPDFTEHDLLWDPIYEEANGQRRSHFFLYELIMTLCRLEPRRTQQALNAIFATDPSTYVSLTGVFLYHGRKFDF